MRGRGAARTFALVLLHVLNAADAASMACLVSARPISGMVPSSSAVAGSGRVTHGVGGACRSRGAEGLTGDLDDPAVLCVDPLAVDVSLRAYEGRVLQAKLRAPRVSDRREERGEGRTAEVLAIL